MKPDILSDMISALEAVDVRHIRAELGPDADKRKSDFVAEGRTVDLTATPMGAPK